MKHSSKFLVLLALLPFTSPVFAAEIETKALKQGNADLRRKMRTLEDQLDKFLRIRLPPYESEACRMCAEQCLRIL